MSLAAPNTDVTTPPDSSGRRFWAKFRRRVARQLILLTIFLTLYVLSIGPMWWSWYSGMYVSTESNYWVIAFYEPLRLACQIDVVNSVVTAYIEWWNL